MSHTVYDENAWLCIRCYRFNVNEDQCVGGCGYASGDKIFRMVNWVCLHCDRNNVTELFGEHRCLHCHKK
jgi:hypothetical protein